MNDLIVYVPQTVDEAELLAVETDRRIFHKFTPPEGPIYAGKCAACDKDLEDGARGANRGYASGLELGLCGRCTTDVNTPEAIEAGERLIAESVDAMGINERLDLRKTALGSFAKTASEFRRRAAK